VRRHIDPHAYARTPSRAGKGVVKFSTSGIDGRVVVWDVLAVPGIDAAALGLK